MPKVCLGEASSIGSTNILPPGKVFVEEWDLEASLRAAIRWDTDGRPGGGGGFRMELFIVALISYSIRNQLCWSYCRETDNVTVSPKKWCRFHTHRNGQSYVQKYCGLLQYWCDSISLILILDQALVAMICRNYKVILTEFVNLKWIKSIFNGLQLLSIRSIQVRLIILWK